MVLQAGLAGCCRGLGPAPTSPSAARSPAAATPALDELIGFFVNTLVLRTEVVGQPELQRAARAGARRQSCGLWACRSAVRAAGGGAQSGAVAVAASAVPGDAGVRGGARRRRARSAGACGAAAAGGDRERQVRSVARADRAAHGRGSAGRHRRRRWNMPATCSTLRRLRVLASGWCGCWGLWWRTAAVRSAGLRSWARPSATPSCAAGTTPRILRRTGLPAPARRRAMAKPVRRTPRRSCGGATLPELFAAQASRTPEAVAVLFEDRALSYAALEAHANRLAHHLQSRGVGPEDAGRAAGGAFAGDGGGAAGILKAGGAYLPLDPNYPRERLAFMLADAGCAWWCAGARLRRRAAAGWGLRHPCLMPVSERRARLHCGVTLRLWKICSLVIWPT